MLTFLICYLWCFGYALTFRFFNIMSLRSSLVIYGILVFLHFCIFGGVLITQSEGLRNFLTVVINVLITWCSMEDFWGSTIWHDLMVDAWREREELDRLALSEWKEKMGKWYEREGWERVRVWIFFSFFVELGFAVEFRYPELQVLWLLSEAIYKKFFDPHLHLTFPSPQFPPSLGYFLDFFDVKLREAFKK